MSKCSGHSRSGVGASAAAAAHELLEDRGAERVPVGEPAAASGSTSSGSRRSSSPLADELGAVDPHLLERARPHSNTGVPKPPGVATARSRCRAGGAARRHRHRRDGRDDGQLGRRARLRDGRPLEPRPRRRAAPPRGAGELTYIGIRHEGAAAFAASAYGKLTGRPAACLTIAGPGATNLLTGLWDAKVDRAPVLALTGQVDMQVLGPGAFQEVDLAAAFGRSPPGARPVLPDSDHAELMDLACKHALLRRDVAHLIFPDDVQTLPAPERAAGGPEGRSRRRRSRRPRSRSTTRWSCSRGAQRPVIIVGHGARTHMADVIALAERLGAPVITTFKAKGQIADDHPLAAGVLGRSGTPVASWLMNEADLLLVLGASFSNHTGIYAGHPIIQVDFDPLQLGKFHAGRPCRCWGDIGVAVERLRARAPGAAATRRPAPRQLAARWAIWRAEKAQPRGRRPRRRASTRAAVFAALERQIPDDAVIAVDVGNHAYSFGRYFECKGQHGADVRLPRLDRLRLPGRDGRLGAPRRTRPIVAVTGDGGFAQYMAELTTAVKHGMNITHVLLNNGQLGKIAKEQRAGEWDVWQTSLHNPDFSALRANCGALGIRVDRPRAARRRARRGRRPRRPGDGRGHDRPRPRLRPRFRPRAVGNGSGRAHRDDTLCADRRSDGLLDALAGLGVDVLPVLEGPRQHLAPRRRRAGGRRRSRRTRSRGSSSQTSRTRVPAWPKSSSSARSV